MIEESARVVRVDGAQLWVEVDRKSACASCSSRSGCGQKKLIEWLPGKRVEIAIDNPRQLIVSPGQEVVLGLREGALMRASLLLYMVPLCGMIFLALGANFAGLSESFQIVSSILGLMVGLLATRVISIRELAIGDYSPRLLRVL